jgi:mRNA interferase MazF
MGKFVVGDVVAVVFPFSDLSGQKLRPALVLAHAEFDNLILCQITSKSYTSKVAIKIEATDFSKGTLPVVSYARPDKIFTAEPVIVQKAVGKLNRNSLRSILEQVQKQFELPD